jgi:serine/threonine-protein kinase RIO1
MDNKDYDADTAILIDFGQTVDSKHPDAMELLRRDVQTIRQFFVRQGVRTPSVDDVMKYITSGGRAPPSHDLKEESPGKP